MRSALVAGHICVDLVPELSTLPEIGPGELAEVGPLSLHAGGCVTNTGTLLATLGTAVQVAGEIGDDELGATLLRLLDSRNVRTAQIRPRPGLSTSYSLVLQPAGVDRSFWHHVGANAAFDGSTLDLAGVDLLHLGYPSLLPALVTSDGAPMERLLRRAREAGVTTSLDLAVLDPSSPAARENWPALLQRWLPLVDVLSPSLDDVRTALRLGGDSDSDDSAALPSVAEHLVDLGAAVVMLTGGPAGIQLSTAGPQRLADAGAVFVDAAQRAAWSGQSRFTTPPPVQVRSTLGAGDAASAGLLHGLLAGLGPDRSLELAARTAAAVISGSRRFA